MIDLMGFGPKLVWVDFCLNQKVEVCLPPRTERATACELFDGGMSGTAWHVPWRLSGSPCVMQLEYDFTGFALPPTLKIPN